MRIITELKEVPVGKTFEIWDRKYTVLESNEDAVFVISNEIEAKMAFRKDEGDYTTAPNDFRDSTIRNWLNDEYLGRLQEDGLKSGDILDLEIDLKCTLGQREYGIDEVMVGLLTLEQYGKYYNIIPKVDSWWYLATPWKTPSYLPNTNDIYRVWYVSADGFCYDNYCSTIYGVRPVLNLNPSLLVAWEDGKEHTERTEAEKWIKNWVKDLESEVKQFTAYADFLCSPEWNPEEPISYEDWKKQRLGGK